MVEHKTRNFGRCKKGKFNKLGRGVWEEEVANKNWGEKRVGRGCVYFRHEDSIESSWCKMKNIYRNQVFIELNTLNYILQMSRICHVIEGFKRFFFFS